MDFDLTERPWVPVLMLDNTEQEMGLGEVFARAHQIRRLSAGQATTDAALLRLLLAIAHDALDGPADDGAWASLWNAGRFAQPVHDYLHTHRDRFDLLHPSAPFFQVPGLEISAGAAPAERIVPEVPNNTRFFTMRQGRVRLTFAEAARYLVEAHAYDTSGIKPAAAGDPRGKGGKVYPLGTGWAGKIGTIVVSGQSLAHTLLLNLAPGRAEADVPAWRRPTLGAAPMAEADAERAAAGPRSLYTWQSRRVRLVYDADGVHGVLLCYGDPLQAQDRTEEPMTPWRRNEFLERSLKRAPVYTPQKALPGTAVWRMLPWFSGADEERLPSGVGAHLARQVEAGALSPQYRVRLEPVQVEYGTQQSVFDEIASDFLDVAAAALGAPWSDVAARADRCAFLAVKSLGHLAGDIAEAAGSPRDPHMQEARERGWDVLEMPCRNWMSQLGQENADPEAWMRQWQVRVRIEIRHEAEKILSAAGEKAWEGRVLTRESGQVWLTTGLAESRFNGALRRALPLAEEPAPAPV